MFICKDCALESSHWLFDMEMEVSHHSCCAVCGTMTTCVDLQSDCIDIEKVIEKRKNGMRVAKA